MDKLIKELELKIEESYESGITLEEAEKLAAKFLRAQILISRELQKTDLDSRMKKSGVKALKAALYLVEVQKTDKKPSDVLLGNLVDSNELVVGEQNAFDTAETRRDELERYYNIFREAHVHYRQVSKGRFE